MARFNYLLLFIGLVFLNSASVLAFTPISSCSVDPISAGEWRLTNDLITIEDSCLDIYSNDVVLDCQGNSIIWNGTGIGKTVYGIHAKGQVFNPISNVTIKNCDLKNFSVGIELEQVAGNMVLNNSLRSTYYHGMGTYGINTLYSKNTTLLENSVVDYAYSVADQSSSNLTIRKNIIYSNFEFGLYSNTGLYLVSSTKSLVEENVFQNIPTGAYLYLVKNTTVQDNEFSKHTYGLFVDVNSQNNTIYNNTLNDSVYSFFVRGLNNSFFHNTLYTGGVLEDLANLNNTYCTGVGNLYLNGSGKDRGRGDCGPMPNVEVFTVDPANETRLTFDILATGTIFIKQPISEAVENTNAFKQQTVLVTPGSRDFNETIFFKFLNHTILDCQGNKIHPSNNLVTGITIRNSFNITIQNCVIEDYTDSRKAIHVISSGQLNILENELLGSGYGVYVEGVDDFLFLNNLVFNNNINGLFMKAPVKKGFISSNTFALNGVGMYFEFPPVNNLTIAYNNIDQNTPYRSILNAQSGNISAKLNWWGTTDEALINQSITDFYDDRSLGIVDFHPFLSSPVSPVSFPFLNNVLPPNSIDKFSAHQLVITSGYPPYSWSVVNGTVPTNMTLHPDGVLNGTPTSLGNYTFTVQVIDGANQTQEVTVFKEIVAEVPSNVFIRKWGTIPVPGRISDYFIIVENKGSEQEDIIVTEFLEPWFIYISSNPEPDNISTAIILPNEINNLTSNLTLNISLSWNATLDPGQYSVISYKVLLAPAVPLGAIVRGTACWIERIEIDLDKLKHCRDLYFNCYLPSVETVLIPPPELVALCTGILLGCWSTAFSFAAGGGDSISAGGVSPGSPGGSSCDIHDDDTVPSRDPNEKGVSANTFILPDQTLMYPIHFENVGNVSALDVFVNDTLEPALNLSTLEVFANGSFIPLRENQTVTLFNQTKIHTYNFTDNETNETIYFNVTVYENWTARLEGRTVFWSLYGIEVEPNASNQVLLSIKPLENLSSGTEIRNNATIQFDIFELMTTNSTLNIIDGIVPECLLNLLPKETPSRSINLSWATNDSVGEIDVQRIYVSENNSAFKLLVRNESVFFNDTNETFYYNSSDFNSSTMNYTFTGLPDTTYGFLCIASDTAGNVEVQDAAAEAVTTVNLTGINYPPVLEPIGSRIIEENQTLFIQLTALDPNNDSLIFATNADSVLPSAFSFNETTGVFQWTPDLDDFGEYNVSFNVTDGEFTDEETITITVENFGLTLAGPFPGNAGVFNTLAVTKATPASTVYFVYGLQSGSTPIPGCQSERVNIRSPIVVGSKVADSSGNANLTVFVPSQASGLTVFLQAVELANCRASNLVVYSFPGTYVENSGLTLGITALPDPSRVLDIGKLWRWVK